MPMSAWDFLDSDWSWPDPRDPRYWSCLSEALKERCAAVTAFSGTEFDLSFLSCDAYENKNIPSYFDIASYDGVLRDLVEHYLITPESSLLNEMKAWLDDHYDFDGTIALHKDTGNAMYVVYDDTVWAVNVNSTLSFDRGWRGYYTWDSVCIDFASTPSFPYEMTATPNPFSTTLFDNSYIRQWLMSRKCVIQKLKILSYETETLVSSFEFNGSYDLYTYEYYQEANPNEWWPEIPGWHSCLWNICQGGYHYSSCYGFPQDDECSTVNESESAQTVNYAGNLRISNQLGRKYEKSMATLYDNTQALCSGPVQGYLRYLLNITNIYKASNLAVDICVTGKAKSILNVVSITGTDIANVEHIRVDFDSDRQAREKVVTISSEVPEPTLEYDDCANITGQCESYGSDNRGIQGYTYRKYVAKGAGCNASAAYLTNTTHYNYNRSPASQAQINSDPVSYSNELVCIESELTKENMLDFKFN